VAFLYNLWNSTILYNILFIELFNKILRHAEKLSEPFNSLDSFGLAQEKQQEKYTPSLSESYLPQFSHS
jgi:hypothetical protein